MAVLLHVMSAGVAVIWGLDWAAGTSGLTHMSGALHWKVGRPGSVWQVDTWAFLSAHDVVTSPFALHVGFPRGPSMWLLQGTWASYMVAEDSQKHKSESDQD